MRHHKNLKALAPWVAAFGLSPECRIKTPDGDVLARDLRVGDLVTTRDSGDQPITDCREAIGAIAERNHYPIRIPQGAMGFGLPHADLMIGPQHRILFQHIRVPLLFGCDAVLVRAKSLAASHERVFVERASAPVSYVQLSLAKQDVIYAEGLPVETVMPDGDCALDFPILRSWELMAAVA